MGDVMDDPNHWLEQAKNARNVAKQLKDKSMRAILEDIAKSYERIADHVTRNLKGAGHGSR